MNIYLIVASVLLLFIILVYMRKKRAKEKVVSINDDKCTTCQRCVKMCRHNVLEVVNDETGRHLAIAYPDKCTACKKCIEICKFDALQLVSRMQEREVGTTHF